MEEPPAYRHFPVKLASDYLANDSNQKLANPTNTNSHVKYISGKNLYYQSSVGLVQYITCLTLISSTQVSSVESTARADYIILNSKRNKQRLTRQLRCKQVNRRPTQSTVWTL